MVAGKTLEQRQQARDERSRKRGAAMARDRIATAATAQRRLGFALDYAQAVGKDLGDADTDGFGRAITQLTDEWSRRR